jgi:hypothetical protein
MADQVKGVQVLADFIGNRIENEAFRFKLLDDRLLALRTLPALEEIVEACKTLLERRLGEVAQRLGDQFAVLVEVFDALGDDFRADAIDINLFLPFTAVGDGDVGRKRKRRWFSETGRRFPSGTR